MIAAIFLAALVAAPVSTLSLFTRRPTRPRVETGPRYAARLSRTLVATVILAAAVGAGLALVHLDRTNLVAAMAGLVVASLLWMPFTRRWGALGHLCWSTSTLLLGAYLVFMLQWTVTSHLGAAGTVGGLLLLLLEAWAAVLGCAYMWELCDTLGREVWMRRVTRQPSPPADQGYRPFVSLQVPAYNEPPDMVIQTLASLMALHYDNYEVICIDDNSDDETLWGPVDSWCLANGVKFVHLEGFPGYKSGALNYALQHLTDPRAEVVGVVDSDYRLAPDFLSRCVPLFSDPTVGFVQPPQDYRDWQQAPFYRRLYYSYSYFFAVSQPSRNERDGAIFAGTTGLIRLSALVAVGGWDEWCITEDAELSLRLLQKGDAGLHVDQSYGQGIMPLTFESLKKQRFRWCFGGVQILRRHWRSLLPGPKSPRNQMTAGQRWAYFSGAIQWYGDLLGIIFFFVLLAGAVNVAVGGGLLFRKLSGFLVAAITFMAALGIVRAVALLRRGTDASWADALGAFMIWQSTSLVVARACIQGLFAKEAEFLRTPKTDEVPKWSDAIRGNKGETALALIGVAGIAAALTRPTTLAGALTAALLLWPTVSFAAAPINSLAARRAALPPELQARRSTEAMRTRSARQATAALGAVVLAGCVAAAVLALIAPGPSATAPRVLQAAQGHGAPVVGRRAPATTTTTTPTSAPTSTPTSTPSLTPTSVTVTPQSTETTETTTGRLGTSTTATGG
ncbi:MAG: glycosyltransferase family 2 protein [Acidimicrobiales bacterium]